jgi:hypothetical protein
MGVWDITDPSVSPMALCIPPEANGLVRSVGFYHKSNGMWDALAVTTLGHLFVWDLATATAFTATAVTATATATASTSTATASTSTTVTALGCGFTAISSDGHFIAVASEDSVRVFKYWGNGTYQEKWCCSGTELWGSVGKSSHLCPVMALAFSPDTSLLGCAWLNGRVSVFKTEREDISRHCWNDKTYNCNTDRITSLAFVSTSTVPTSSPASTVVLCGCHDGSIQIHSV